MELTIQTVRPSTCSVISAAGGYGRCMMTMIRGVYIIVALEQIRQEKSSGNDFSYKNSEVGGKSEKKSRKAVNFRPICCHFFARFARK
jgi:hypothetical protein